MIHYFPIQILLKGNFSPYQEREIYIVYDPLNISKLSLDIIQEMLNFKKCLIDFIYQIIEIMILFIIIFLF